MGSMPQFDMDTIDEVIHGRIRLGVMAYLASASPASFNELLSLTSATNGNLGMHLRKLEEAGYVRQHKGYLGRRPHTLVHLTGKGREAWILYLEALAPLFSKRRRHTAREKG